MRWLVLCTAPLALLAVLIAPTTNAAPTPKQVAPTVKQAVGPQAVVVKPTQVQPANLQAAAILYEAAVLEELRLFAVVDRLVELFQAGKLPLSAAGKKRFANYVSSQPKRLDEQERRALYGHVLGKSSGKVAPNSAFNPLFLRLLSAVDDYDRQHKLPASKKKAISVKQVHTAARDLATHLSNRSYGAPVAGAKLIAGQLADSKVLLGDGSLLKHYGVSDMWQLIERVAKSELSKKVNASAARRQAEAGRDILDSLAKLSAPLSSFGGAEKEVADALIRSHVPRSAKDIDRTSSDNGTVDFKPSAATSKVAALCYFSGRQLRPCKITLKK